MKVGDLVKLNNITGGIYTNLRGIVIRIDKKGLHEVLWADGELTQEFNRDLDAA